jgi:uncharacterized phage-associated protein
MSNISNMMIRAPYDARAVANLLLDTAAERGLDVTQLLLNKVIYFAHGWFLSRFNAPLIKQEFEAWELGPVVKVLRDEFRQFERRPITTRAFRLDILSGRREIVEPHFSTEDKQFILDIFRSYYQYGAWKLSEMTHEKNSPWDKIWNSRSPIGRLALRIKNEEIKAHFDGLGGRLHLS